MIKLNFTLGGDPEVELAVARACNAWETVVL